MIKAKVTLTQPGRKSRQFVATTGGGHSFLMDDAEGASGPKPIELVAAALAGCTAFDVINILRKKRQQITGYEVFVEADQAADPPTVFTNVRIRHVVTGIDIRADAVEGAIRLSEEKYCAVGAMIRQAATIETSYEILEDQTAEQQQVEAVMTDW